MFFTPGNLTLAIDSLLASDTSQENRRAADEYLRAFQSDTRAVVQHWRQLTGEHAQFFAAQCLLTVAREQAPIQLVKDVLDQLKTTGNDRLILVLAAIVGRCKEWLDPIHDLQIYIPLYVARVFKAVPEQLPASPDTEKLNYFRLHSGWILENAFEPSWSGIFNRIGIPVLSNSTLVDHLISNEKMDDLIECLENSPNAYVLADPRPEKPTTLSALSELYPSEAKALKLVLSELLSHAEGNESQLATLLNRAWTHLLLDLEISPRLLFSLQKILSQPEGCLAFGEFWDEIKAATNTAASPGLKVIFDAAGFPGIQGAIAVYETRSEDQLAIEVADEVSIAIFILAEEYGQGGSLLGFLGNQMESQRPSLAVVAAIGSLLAGEEQLPKEFIDILRILPRCATPQTLPKVFSILEDCSIHLGRKIHSDLALNLLDFSARFLPSSSRAIHSILTFAEEASRFTPVAEWLIGVIRSQVFTLSDEASLIAGVMAVLRSGPDLDISSSAVLGSLHDPTDIHRLLVRTQIVSWGVIGRDGYREGPRAPLPGLAKVFQQILDPLATRLFDSFVRSCAQSALRVRMDTTVSSLDETVLKTMRLVIRAVGGLPCIAKICKESLDRGYLNASILAADIARAQKRDTCCFRLDNEISEFVRQSSTVAISKGHGDPHFWNFVAVCEPGRFDSRVFRLAVLSLSETTDQETIVQLTLALLPEINLNLEIRSPVAEAVLKRFHLWPRVCVANAKDLLEASGSLQGLSMAGQSWFPFLSETVRVRVLSSLRVLRGPRLKLFLIACHNLANGLELNASVLDPYFEVTESTRSVIEL